MALPDIVVTRADFERLSALLDSASAAEVSDYLDTELNRARIGTGDPDLLMVGTKLTLR